MARAAAKGGKRPQPDAQRARKGGGRRNLSPAEETLFFSRIRTHAKWMFVLLALVFAGGFVFFGVGSGSNGAGSLSDLFNNVFNGGSSGPSVSKSLKETQKNPNDAKAWKNLATAYGNKGETDNAINAWIAYVALRPKDATGLATLAALQTNQAQSAAADAQAAQSQSPFSASVFRPPATAKLGQALGQDPVQQAIESQASTATSEASARATTAYQQALTTYQQLAKVTPRDASVQLEVAQTAEAAQNYTAAIAAYERAAKLLPDQAAQIRARIKQLRAVVPSSG